MWYVCIAVCMTPYVMGFMANILEIRMASNGSLIQTINIPDLHVISSKVSVTSCILQGRGNNVSVRQILPIQICTIVFQHLIDHLS